MMAMTKEELAEFNERVEEVATATYMEFKIADMIVTIIKKDVPVLLTELNRLQKIEAELIEFLGMMEPWYVDKTTKKAPNHKIVIKAFRNLARLVDKGVAI